MAAVITSVTALYAAAAALGITVTGLTLKEIAEQIQNKSGNKYKFNWKEIEAAPISEYSKVATHTKATEEDDETYKNRLNDMANNNAAASQLNPGRYIQDIIATIATEKWDIERDRLNDLANENAAASQLNPNRYLTGENTSAVTGTTIPSPEQKPEEEKQPIVNPGVNFVEDKTNDNIEQEVGQTWSMQDIMNYYKNQQFEQWAREDEIRKETQEREDTAYQRAVADMKKAGINPNLMNVSPADSGGGITQATGMDSSAITKKMENTSQELIALLNREFEGDENTQKQIMTLIGELINSAAMIYAFKK